MRAVDTNVVVRLIARDDKAQTAAAESFVSKGAWISQLVLVETTWVLDAVFGLNHKQLVVAVEMLLHHRDLVLQDPDVVASALANFRKRPKVGFSDCMILEGARKAGHTPVGTFDCEFGKLEGTERV